MSVIAEFIDRIKAIHATGNATEHSYRSAFERLFDDLGVTALNEPRRVKCGAPDFIISVGEIVIVPVVEPAADRLRVMGDGLALGEEAEHFAPALFPALLGDGGGVTHSFSPPP
jgi:hypothetical protein